MPTHIINVPDIGEGIAEVEIVEWPVKLGDMVKEDDVICVVMTDKATVEIPSPVDGKITWIGAEAGDMMAVGAEFIHLEVEDISQTTDMPTLQKVLETSEEIKSDVIINQQPTVIETNVNSIADKPIASPAVRQRARKAGIDLRLVRGSGPAKQISHGDLDSYIAGDNSQASNSTTVKSNDTSVKAIKVIGLRRKIAAVMQDTMQRIPHFTYVEEIDVTELESLRAKLNIERREEQEKLTILPFIIKAMVKAMKIYPEMSSRYDDKENIVHRYAAAHIGIATQTDNGLVVPVVKHAETLDIWQSAAEVKRLSTAARSGSAKSEELTGSTITITSLGPMGGIVTTPVINSPEVAIIGINKIAKRPVWRDGMFVPRDIMNISASFDHRIIDGWEATLFVQQIKGLLEAPATLFMD